ncbi:DUF3159 domain-containing protein [Pseudonocardiaceae bacterium YIM PH 21723]|nr:DUF3159 domain-containing protein [Pseudonocardiaceae bacterium YIM PH 21723]
MWRFAVRLGKAESVQKQESLADLLGGRRGAVDATLPSVAFVAAWLLSHSVHLGALIALVLGLGLGGWRMYRGERWRPVLIGLFGVAAAVIVVLYTGRAQDFFLLQIAMNAASFFGFIISIVLRWPLLGVIVGAVLGQKTRWRKDPDLLRAYSRASWAFLVQYLIRVVVFGALWLSGSVLALGIARVALSWPLQAASLAAAWWALRSALPEDHPGLRHPRVPESAGA